MSGRSGRASSTPWPSRRSRPAWSPSTRATRLSLRHQMQRREQGLPQECASSRRGTWSRQAPSGPCGGGAEQLCRGRERHSIETAPRRHGQAPSIEGGHDLVPQSCKYARPDHQHVRPPGPDYQSIISLGRPVERTGVGPFAEAASGGNVLLCPWSWRVRPGEFVHDGMMVAGVGPDEAFVGCAVIGHRGLNGDAGLFEEARLLFRQAVVSSFRWLGSVLV